MDSGRYFWLVRLDSCLKRMPDLAVTSSKSGGVVISPAAPSNWATGAAASARSRKDRRFIFEDTLPLFSANWRRGFPSQIHIFLGECRFPQPRVHLAQKAVNLQIDHASSLGTRRGFF